MYGTTFSSTRNSLLNQFWFPSYKVRLFRSKAALVILLWVFTAFLSIIFAYNLPFGKYYFIYLGGVCALSAPIALLADVYLGRYKVIQYSMRLLWITAIASNTIIIAFQHYKLKNEAISNILILFTIIEVAGSVGIVVNSLQFGIDQLTDASSSEIASYISWYTWTSMFAFSTGIIFTSCIIFYGLTLPYFILPLFSTLSILTDCFFNRWLVKEPVTNNPLKVIHQVVKYAVKNKYPRLRSAFTYWEDKPYSRIDLGKTKYGGPFTSEQVEDVKTFFRILAILVIFTPTIILVFCLRKFFYSQYLDGQFFQRILMQNFTAKLIKTCYYETALYNLEIMTVALLVPVIEFFLYPLVIKCTCCINFSILPRFLLGIFVIILYELHLLGIELVVTHTSADLHNSTCFFYVSEETVSLYWLIPPKALYGIALYIILTSSLEFIAAQAPYSMRGLLFGIYMFLFGLSGALSLFSYLLVSITRKHAMESDGANCEFWLYDCILVLTIASFCAVFIVKKWYTHRRRDDDLPNEQKFAVDYYDKYLSQVS